MIDDIIEKFKEFQEKNKEFRDLTIYVPDETLIKTENSELDNDDVKEIINVWNNHLGTLNLKGVRYVLLKTDPLQLAGVAPSSGNRGIVGTCIKGKYAICLLDKSANNINASSIYLQKWIFDKL